MTDKKKIEIIPEKRHAALGGSSAERWSVCTMAGVHMVNKDGKKNEGSVYAAWGTVAHEIAERMIHEGRKEVKTPEAFKVGSHVIDVEPEHIATSWEFARPCIQLAKACKHWGVETEVSLDWIYPDGKPPYELFGHVDFWGYHSKSDTLYIVDLKGGKGVPVSAHQNKQMFYYAVGVLGMLKEKYGIEPKNIKVTIIQPRCADEPDVYECPTQEVLDWATEEMVPAIDAIHEGATACEYAPAEKRCQFCPVPPACPALLDKLADTLKGDVENVVDMSSEDLGKLLDDLQLLAALKKKAEAEVCERLTRQIPVPGWHMKPKRTIRKWFDGGKPGGDVERFLYSFLEDDAFHPRQVLSPAQAEKVFKSKGFELKGFDNLVEKSSSGYTLGRDDDKHSEDDD